MILSRINNLISSVNLKTMRSHFFESKIKVGWLLFALFVTIIVSLAIAEARWQYLGVLFLPVLLFALRRPFVFPFGLYVFLLPLEAVTQLSGSGRGATFVKMLGLLSLVIFLLKGSVEERFRKPDKAGLWVVLFVVYCFLTTIWAIQPTYMRFTPAVGLLLLYLVVTSQAVKEADYNFIKWVIFLSGLSAAALINYAYFTNMSSSRTSLSIGEMTTGLNKQAFDLLFPIAVGMAIMLDQKKILVKIVILCTILAMVFGLILTGSRGSAIALVAIMLIYFTHRKDKIRLGIILCIAGAVLVPFVPDFFEERLADSVDSGASGRFDIWIVGLSALQKYWLTGAGLDNFPVAYTEYVLATPTFMGLGRAAHNIFVGNFVELGIVGLSLLIMMMFVHYRIANRDLKSCNTDVIMFKAAFWGLLVSSMALDSVWYKSLWLLWMMIVIRKNSLAGNE